MERTRVAEILQVQHEHNRERKVAVGRQEFVDEAEPKLARRSVERAQLPHALARGRVQRRPRTLHGGANLRRASARKSEGGERER